MALDVKAEAETLGKHGEESRTPDGVQGSVPLSQTLVIHLSVSAGCLFLASSQPMPWARMHNGTDLLIDTPPSFSLLLDQPHNILRWQTSHFPVCNMTKLQLEDMGKNKHTLY